MAVDRLPGGVREFASYLDGLLARLDQGGGWSGVFWQRDPDGMRACIDGREVPPWDVVEALLEDLAAAYGPAAAAAERERARALYRAALTACDARPGARDTLLDRLDVMLREQRYAAERQAELTRLLSAPASAEQAESLRLDLAWAQDDHERATARCTELQARLTELDRRGAPDADALRHGGEPGPRRAEGAAAGAGQATPSGVDLPRQAAAPAPHAVPQPPRATQSSPRSQAGGPPSPHNQAGGPPSPHNQATTPPPVAPEPPRTPAKARKRRRGSARFAGMVGEGDVAEAGAAPAVVPEASARRAPRGARFAGGVPAAEPVAAPAEVVDAETGAAVAGVVERLARLRGEGRTGEAHVLLVEIVQWPAGRFPALADALHRAGLGADWATLLWEAASLPAERLAAAADALAAAGREADGRQMLRQGVARPAEQIGAAVLRLAGEGRRREAEALLDACVRVRPAEEAARSVVPDPPRLVPLLLRAAQAVSDERHWDLVHALRVAGHAT
ncbi:hypothetical protein ACWCQS_20200 [Streptomyces sp. NPDC002076]